MAQEKETQKNNEDVSVDDDKKSIAGGKEGSSGNKEKISKEKKEQPKKQVADKMGDGDKKGTKKVEALAVPESAKKGKQRKFRRQVQRGCAYIRSSYNNTVVSFTDLHGNMLAWSSSGLLGFKGAKKATTYAAMQVVLDVHEKAQKYGLRDVEVYIKGVGSGREAALRALAQKGYNLTKIKDITPIPHNGCRAKKPRRV